MILCLCLFVEGRIHEEHSSWELFRKILITGYKIILYDYVASLNNIY